MPTKAEVEELLDKCTFYWSTDYMVNGCVVVGPMVINCSCQHRVVLTAKQMKQKTSVVIIG